MFIVIVLRNCAFFSHFYLNAFNFDIFTLKLVCNFDTTIHLYYKYSFIGYNIKNIKVFGGILKTFYIFMSKITFLTFLQINLDICQLTFDV